MAFVLVSLPKPENHKRKEGYTHWQVSVSSTNVSFRGNLTMFTNEGRYY